MRIALCAAVAFLLLTSPVRSQELTKAELAKRGKAATGFLEVAGRGTATAFCVHPSGIFVTNEHAIGSDGKRDIKIVMDAGQKTQKTHHATVIRADKNLDLALLRVESKNELPTLPLGTDTGIGELMEVVAFGFPLGTIPGSNKKKKDNFPAMTVAAGQVSALRREDDFLSRIQIDASVTFGNSGGPVLDEERQGDRRRRLGHPEPARTQPRHPGRHPAAVPRRARHRIHGARPHHGRPRTAGDVQGHKVTNLVPGRKEAEDAGLHPGRRATRSRASFRWPARTASSSPPRRRRRNRMPVEWSSRFTSARAS